MIAVKLKDVLEARRRRTGMRMTYADLSARSGIPLGTIKKIASILKYRPSLLTIEKLCRALEATPGDLLELMDDPPERTVTKSRKATKRRPRRRE
jgi:DNA-binding Xre family transcriptional regulator